MLDPAGIAVSNGPGDASTPFVACNGTDFYVVWAQPNSTWRIYGTLVTANGTVVHPGGESPRESARCST